MNLEAALRSHQRLRIALPDGPAPIRCREAHSRVCSTDSLEIARHAKATFGAQKTLFGRLSHVSQQLAQVDAVCPGAFDRATRETLASLPLGGIGAPPAGRASYPPRLDERLQASNTAPRLARRMPCSRARCPPLSPSGLVPHDDIVRCLYYNVNALVTRCFRHPAETRGRSLPHPDETHRRTRS